MGIELAAIGTFLSTSIVTVGGTTLLTVGNVVTAAAIAGLTAASNYFAQQEEARRRAGLGAALGSTGIGPQASGAGQPSRSTIAMMPYAIGETAVAGVVFFEDDSRPPFYYLGLVLSAEQIDAVTGVEINGERVNWNAAGDVTTAPFAVGTRSLVRLSIRLGARDQAADPLLLADFPALGSEFRQRGRATIVLRCDYGIDDAEHRRVWEGGVKVRVFVRGIRCHDPASPASRVDDPATWTWTDSPSRLAAHFARHPDFGRLPAARVDDRLIAQAAAVDGEGVNDGAGIVRRWRAGGVVDTSAGALGVLRDLMAANRGRIVNSSCRLGVVAGAWAEPCDDPRSHAGARPISWEGAVPRDRLCNTVRTAHHPPRP